MARFFLGVPQGSGYSLQSYCLAKKKRDNKDFRFYPSRKTRNSIHIDNKDDNSK